MENSYFQLYSEPTNGSLPHFKGAPRYMMGHGIWGSLARFVFPILKEAVPHILNIAKNTLQDTVEKRMSVKDAIRKNIRNEFFQQHGGSYHQSSINKKKKKKRQQDIFDFYPHGKRRRSVGQE